jgi:hypothetical protein
MLDDSLGSGSSATLSADTKHHKPVITIWENFIACPPETSGSLDD